MPRITKLVSFWAFVALAALLALQAFPVTGIFLMMFGAALLSGALVHIFLLSLFFEALVGRVPRVLMILPVAAYGAYYAVYFHQGIEIARKSAEMKASNPGMILDFDPRSLSLVTADAQTLVQRYAVPVVYETNPNFPEGYLSYRLIRRDQCGIRKDSQHRIQTFGMHRNGRFQQGTCGLRIPEVPSEKIVRAVRHGDDEVWKRKWGIAEQVTEISVDGAVIGSYRSASVWRLPVLPLGYIGCALISSTPAWKCGAEFKREHVVIDTVPAGIDRQSYDSAVSIMLGLKLYSESDIAGFRGYELNDAALARVAAEPERVEEDSFLTLAAIVDGKNPKPAFNLGYSLSRNPNRLVPFAEKMALRFVELNRPESTRVPNRREQLEALATAIVSLPHVAFLSVSDQIFSIIQQERSWERYRALYVRTGEAGFKTFGIYKKDFMSENLKQFTPPLLAICRIGQADDETIAEMKRRFVFGSRSHSDDDYNSALFVTLMKLGQEPFLRENIGTISKRMREWADAVLERKGATKIGPNNCMAMRWNSTNYHGPMMEPGLQLMRGTWGPREQTN